MKTHKMKIRDIVANIEKKQLLDVVSDTGGFRIKINKYVPYCCTAVHHGSQLRKELQKKIALDSYERWYEEDPFTGDFIASMPITLVGLDSRYEYDLNRSTQDCIYKEAWGKKVWKKELTSPEKKISRQKHEAYYQVLHALLTKLEELFGGCVVYDIHSYNYKRWEREVPLFNLGTELLNREKFRAPINHWLKELTAIHLPDIETKVAESDVFAGKGFQAEYITQNFTKTLVLPTEIKKVYCDELSGAAYPRIIRLLQQQLKTAILNNANSFCQGLEKWPHLPAIKLLDKKPDPALLKTDRELYRLLRDFELLAAVNPVNTPTEKKRFFKGNYRQPPEFRYNPIHVDVLALKQQLLDIPLQKIQDVSVRSLYEAVVNSYFDKIDLLRSIGTNRFLYNSLRYFGRPSKTDLQNASFIMHLPPIPGEAISEPMCSVKKAMEVFQQHLDIYGIKAKVEIDARVISQVMVLNSTKSILFQPDATFKTRELAAIIEHEIGVHMLTTTNSNKQKLKIFNLGLPLNTLTQEGLAVLAEYLSGNLSLNRLKKLALRTIMVDMMCNGADFLDCFHSLIRDYELNEKDAFNLSARVFRGGGFTKDHLYLSGFVKVLQFWEDQNDLTPLLIGKTSLNFYPTILEMIGREMIAPPQHLTRSFQHPVPENNNPIYNYILDGLKKP